MMKRVLDVCTGA